MLYLFDNFLSQDAFQSWFAAARDQATMQLIAVSTMQQQIEGDLKKAIDSSALLLEKELELPFELGAVPIEKVRGSRHANGARAGR